MELEKGEAMRQMACGSEEMQRENGKENWAEGNRWLNQQACKMKEGRRKTELKISGWGKRRHNKKKEQIQNKTELRPLKGWKWRGSDQRRTGSREGKQ